MSTPGPAVTLGAVDEPTLKRLVEAAVTDASVGEVTPPLTTGDEWSPARIAWLRHFHRDRRDGLGGSAGEATWAVLHAGRVVGSVRLKRSAVPDILETGIWLTRHARGQGLGRLTMIAALQTAAALGYRGVRADTTVGNAAAIGLLRSLGFDRQPSEDRAGVEALLLLASDSLPHP